MRLGAHSDLVGVMRASWMLCNHPKSSLWGAPQLDLPRSVGNSLAVDKTRLQLTSTDAQRTFRSDAAYLRKAAFSKTLRWLFCLLAAIVSCNELQVHCAVVCNVVRRSRILRRPLET